MMRFTVLWVSALALACSMNNREGLDLSCAQLENGNINGCKDGIITSCSNGIVRYEVCDDEDACAASWQVNEAFRCNESDEIPTRDVEGDGDAEPSPPAGNDPDGPQQMFAACDWTFATEACASCVMGTCCTVARTCAEEDACESCATRAGNETPCALGIIAEYDAFRECLSGCDCFE